MIGIGGGSLRPAGCVGDGGGVLGGTKLADGRVSRFLERILVGRGVAGGICV